MTPPIAQDETRTWASRAWIRYLVVAVLTVAAFELRHTGVRTFLPHQGEPHERVYATQLKLLRAGDPNPERNPQFDYYPLLVAKLALMTQAAPPATPAATVDELRERSGDDIAHLRTIIALLAALAVPATYALARWFLAPAWSLLAAALYAASPLAISFGQQARPHAAVVAPVIAAIVACLYVRKRPVLWAYVLAGVAVGGALAILHNSIAVLPALVVAHLLRDRSKQKHPWIGACVALVIAAAIAWSTYPHGSLGMGAATKPRDEAADGSHFLFLDQFHGQGFVVVGRALFDYEPWLAPLACLGLAIWLARRLRAHDILRIRGHESLFVVAAWCVPYALAIGAYDVTYERFAIPLLPCFALAGAYAAASTAGWLSSRTVSRTAAVAIVSAVFLAPQAFLAVRLARAWGSTDSVMRCAQWIGAHVPPGSARLAVFNTIDLPLLRTSESLRETPGQVADLTRPWLEYQATLPPDLLASERYELVTVPDGSRAGMALFQSDMPACVASWRADYVIIEVYTPDRRARVAAVRDHLLATATRVARFSPYTDDADNAPFGYSHDRFGQFGWWTGHLLHAEGFGPVVEVYRMR